MFLAKKLCLQFFVVGARNFKGPCSFFIIPTYNPNLIKEGSIICWKHVNLRGEFDFRRYSPVNAKFNLKSILSLKLAAMG